ncbi:MAG: 6-carboxytetrahydropterin synthase, partial [Candidatus Thermoplasmatota archaeon]|nr:6-carboxytetrahydropterin synthase [Candidatus Thermoplasmatota archaeon]
DKCSRIHGHSYAIHLDILGEVDEDNMLADFGKLKNSIRNIAEDLDHRALIPTENPEIVLELDTDPDNVILNMQGKKYSFPKTDVILLPISTTTVEELSKYCLGRFLDDVDLPEGIKKISIGVDEGVGQGAWSSQVIER